MKKIEPGESDLSIVDGARGPGSENLMLVGRMLDEDGKPVPEYLN